MVNKEAYLHANDLVKEYEFTGQWEPLGALGLDGASHDGFLAPRGVKKRDNAWATAAMLREFRIARDEKLKAQLLTFNHTVRTKDAPLTVPQIITDRHARVDVQNSVLHASRMVTYGSTPTVAVGKPFIESFSRGVMQNPNRMVVYQPDSFEPGALRRFYQTWFLIFSQKLPFHDDLMTGARWNQDALGKARGVISGLPHSVLTAFFQLPVRVIDLRGSDSRTPADVTATWTEFCISGLERQGVIIEESTKDLMRSFATAMAKGNLNVGESNLRFTRNNIDEKNRTRAEAIGDGFLDTSGDPQDSTLASGSSAVYISNGMNVAESAMPFTKTEGLSRDQKRLIIELLLRDDSRFSSYSVDMFLESAALLNGGDDGQILPRVDGEPLEPTTWRIKPVVPKKLLEKYIACIGRSLSSYDELPLSKAPFHKRIMRVSYGTVVLEAPLSTVIRRMVYPDKEKDDQDLSYQRPALLAAQLLNGYSNPDAWARCGDFAFRFLKNSGYDFNQLVACYNDGTILRCILA